MKAIVGNINTMPDRQAMGLPDYFTLSSAENLESLYNVMRRKTESELAEIVENPEYKRNERFVAGQLLALLGDPRINPAQPAMLEVPGGYAAIGLPLEDVDAEYNQYKHYGIQRHWIMKEVPKFQVFLPSYRIGKYPVTNIEYREYLLETKEGEIPDSWKFGCFPGHAANHPIINLSLSGIEGYIRWLSKKTGRKFRLPSEYEWEFAAAGPEARAYPWGPVFLSDQANTAEERMMMTTPVGMFPKGKSAYGCLDMAGNVEEYVADNYHAYPGGDWIQDDLAAAGDYRVARGGCYTRFADLARCKRRHGRYARDMYIMGFRLAESI